MSTECSIYTHKYATKQLINQLILQTQKIFKYKFTDKN